MFNLSEAETIISKENKKEIILTGYNDFDILMGGIKVQDLTVFAARILTGKTSFFLNLAYNIAERGTKVLYYTNNPLKEARKILNWQQKKHISLYFEEMFIFDEKNC